MTKHTLKSVKADLKEIVEKKGADYVYNRRDPDDYSTCAYRHGSKPGCIVGHWFAKHGIGVPKDLNTGHGVVSFLAERPGAFEITPKALDYLNEVQWLQDDGVSWGQAVRQAQ